MVVLTNITLKCSFLFNYNLYTGVLSVIYFFTLSVILYIEIVHSSCHKGCCSFVYSSSTFFLFLQRILILDLLYSNVLIK